MTGFTECEISGKSKETSRPSGRWSALTDRIEDLVILSKIMNMFLSNYKCDAYCKECGKPIVHVPELVDLRFLLRTIIMVR